MTNAPEFHLFADESATSGSELFYGIGAVAVKSDKVRAFENYMCDLKKKHGLTTEIKWMKVGKGHGLINFGLEAVHTLLKSKACFTCIIVRKDVYGIWKADKERGFYVTYTNLLKSFASEQGKVIDVTIDYRDDSYAKTGEVTEIIANHMLRKIASTGRIANLKKRNSHDCIGLQIADFLTGAVTLGHNLKANPNLQCKTGKRLCIQKISEMIGWDGLHYDTYPNPDFNIWHFPEETRGETKTLKLSPKIHFVLPEEI